MLKHTNIKEGVEVVETPISLLLSLTGITRVPVRAGRGARPTSPRPPGPLAPQRCGEESEDGAINPGVVLQFRRCKPSHPDRMFLPSPFRGLTQDRGAGAALRSPAWGILPTPVPTWTKTPSSHRWLWEKPAGKAALLPWRVTRGAHPPPPTGSTAGG